jgi:hypothetical protein
MNRKRLIILITLVLCLLVFEIYDWKIGSKSENSVPSISDKVDSTPRLQKPITILQKPVLIKLRQISGGHDEGDYVIDVDYKSDHFSLESEGYDGSLDRFVKICGWKGDYLFVPSWNGCASCHKGEVSHVYKLKKDHLIELGETIVRYEESTPGAEYNNGIFTDLYNKFEINDVTAHYNSPDFWLAIRDEDGKFVVDLNETWSKNEKYFFELKKKLRDLAKLKSDDDKVTHPDATVLDAAVIAKYCREEKELKELMAFVKKHFPLVDDERIEDILKQVVPGEMTPQGSM